MILKLYDKTEIVINQQEANGIMAGLKKGTKMFQVKGMLIAAGAIAIIKPGGYSEADLSVRYNRLPAPDHRGKPSPAKEKIRKRFQHVPPGEQETA